MSKVNSADIALVAVGADRAPDSLDTVVPVSAAVSGLSFTRGHERAFPAGSGFCGSSVHARRSIEEHRGPRQDEDFRCS